MNQGPAQLFFWAVAALACTGCATAPVVKERQDAARHLFDSARAQVSPRPPGYTLSADQADAMPQGSRVVIETPDHDPVRVITATKLKIEGDSAILRTGVVRRLSREWELTAGTDHHDAERPPPTVEEDFFEELRLPLREVQRVAVYLNAEQGTWRRLDEGWRSANPGGK
ncbi:MAG: hypothetical protein EHM42_12065, partial [Planctomycetaceae bacterium]